MRQGMCELGGQYFEQTFLYASFVYTSFTDKLVYSQHFHIKSQILSFTVPPPILHLAMKKM